MTATELAATIASAEAAIAAARNSYQAAREELEYTMRRDVRMGRLHSVPSEDLKVYLALAQESPQANAKAILDIKVTLGRRGH
ncbi:hypothetical protein AB0383_20445 [Amycolatopsis sp. NPDC051373]|uniref:hypothetical protein n=1 Tax=Amycolatopsis sp. NPDC051373 TaxID=3155801 RepID=UPI00344EB328